MTPAAHGLPLATSPDSPGSAGDQLPTPGRHGPNTVLAGLAGVLSSYRTCELATVTKTGTPIAWPAVSWYDRAADQIVLTTSIALPHKAFNVRRDPRVALLYSDPTGSGRNDLPQVLVQGTARCPDEIRTSPEGLEEYWRELWRRLPGSSGYGSTPLDRWLFDFYYMRLVLTVEPTSVTTHPALIRPTPLRRPKPVRGDSPYAQTTRRLAGYVDGVLATAAGGEPPVLRRVRVSADPTTGTLMLAGAGPVETAGATSANLLFHRHDEQLGRLRQFGVVGTLEASHDRFALRPSRVLGGAQATNPLSLARTVHRLRRTSQRYLDHRGLSRPAVPWAAYRRLAAGTE